MSGERDRHVEFDACFNFRDVGGYETVDGRKVRWGSVFRSGSLHRLTPADVERTAQRGLRTVVDLRTAAELDRDGRFVRSDEVAFHHMPFEEPALDLATVRTQPAPPPGEHYVTMARYATNAITGALRVIAEAEHPVLPPWVLGAPLSAMETFLGALREHHGSIDGYLSDAGVDSDVVDRLRARLLEA